MDVSLDVDFFSADMRGFFGAPCDPDAATTTTAVPTDLSKPDARNPTATGSLRASESPTRTRFILLYLIRGIYRRGAAFFFFSRALQFGLHTS
jgi:hypothetical protein